MPGRFEEDRGKLDAPRYAPRGQCLGAIAEAIRVTATARTRTGCRGDVPILAATRGAVFPRWTR